MNEDPDQTQIDDDATLADPPEVLQAAAQRNAARLAEGREQTLHPTSHGSGRVSGMSRVSGRQGTATIEQALLAEEAARCRSFGLVMALLTGICLVLLPSVGGEPWLLHATLAALLWLFFVSLWIWRRGALDERYRPWVFRFFGWSSVVASLFVNYHLGVFSPAPMAVTLGISFFALGDDRTLAFRLSLAATLAYLLLVAGIITGRLPDVGLQRVAHVPVWERAFLCLMVPVVFAVTLLQARQSRAATHEALWKAQRAMLLLAQQEARLHEARLDLDAALRAGAGREGRHSGQRVGGFLLAEVIGRGAMGEVYAASDGEGKEAAVKMLAPSAERDGALFKRFLREGELASRLRSPHVVRVFEVAVTSDGAPYIAMELLHGQDLSALLRQRSKLPLSEAVVMLGQIASGLDVAHAAGVIHRDLKPQNLFRAEHEGGRTWKIVDFGVSKLRGSGGATLTQRAVIGTPGYMAPEQAQGLEAEPRSDVFSLGAVIYRAVTGRPPFAAPDMPQILFAVCYRAPQRPSSLLDGLPPDVDAALAIALAKSPEDRFSTASSFAEALAQAARGELPEQLRARASVLVDALPWGQKSRGTRSVRGG